MLGVYLLREGLKVKYFFILSFFMGFFFFFFGQETQSQPFTPVVVPTGILLQEEKINSVFLLYLMSIPSFCILAVAALVLENWTLLESPLNYDRQLWLFVLLSCLGSVMYNLASSCIITHTSAITLHILGNLSVAGNLLLSQLLFGSEFSALSCVGIALTFSGTLIYQNSELIVGYFEARKEHANASGQLNSHAAAAEGFGGAGAPEVTHPQRRPEENQKDKTE